MLSNLLQILESETVLVVVGHTPALGAAHLDCVSIVRRLQGKKAAALEPATNSIRWTIKPEGTIVSFSQDIELPQIFIAPPPR